MSASIPSNWHHTGRSPADATDWTVEVEIAEPAPVSGRELDVFERYFSDVLDAVFAPSNLAAHNDARPVMDRPSGARRPLDRRGKMR